MSDLEKQLRDALAAKAEAVDTTPTSAEKEEAFLAELRRPNRHSRRPWLLGAGVAAAACVVAGVGLAQQTGDHPASGSIAAVSGAATGTAAAKPSGAGGMTGMAQPGSGTTGFSVPGATVIGPSEVSVTVDGRQLVFRPVISLLRGRLTVGGELQGPAYVRPNGPAFPYAWSVSTSGGGFVEDAALGCENTTRTQLDAARTFGSWTLRGDRTVTISTAVCTAAGTSHELTWTGKVVPRPYG